MTSNVGTLFGTAKQEGAISAGAFNALDVEDLGAIIQQGLGVVPDDIPVSEALGVFALLDDSGSMAGNIQVTCDGYNGMLDALLATKQSEGIVVHGLLMNHGILNPTCRIKEAPRLSVANYRAYGSTPLFDRSIALLGTAIAKTQEFADAGVPFRSVNVIYTDGGDTGRPQRVHDVRTIVEDMLRAESHIIIGFGIDDGVTNFKQVFNDMGIQDQWILTPSNDKSEIRRAFQLVSQSAVRASQGAAAFSKTAMGGFGS